MGYRVYSGGLPRRYGILWESGGPAPCLLAAAPFSADEAAVQSLAERLDREQVAPETFRERFLTGNWM